MWLAAKMAYPNRVTPFKDYAILGDDVLITDGNVASHYREILSKLGVQISDSKSITSHTGCIEFILGSGRFDPYFRKGPNRSEQLNWSVCRR